jgi:hypothetical protein
MSKEVKYLNELAARVHAANIKWWQDPKTGKPIRRNRKGLIALVISELAEALEGERKNLMDDKLPHRRMAEVEMADTVIRLLDFAGGFGITRLIAGSEFRLEVAHDKPVAIFDMMFYATLIGTGSDPHIWKLIDYISSYCVTHGYDLWAALEDKMKFNATRHDHTHEARREKGGKAW